MTRFLHRLAVAIAAASLPLAVAAVATSAVSSAGCDANWSRNVWTGECHPQPGLPDWYVIRPAYAPPYAPVDVPPPPPPPPWAQRMQPRWDEGSQHWFWGGI
jgi:hypothetical protein